MRDGSLPVKRRFSVNYPPGGRVEGKLPIMRLFRHEPIVGVAVPERRQCDNYDGDRGMRL